MPNSLLLLTLAFLCGSGLTDNILPEWTIFSTESFESTVTLFKCDLTNIDCDPLTDHIFIQKYVQNDWHIAIRALNSGNSEVYILPDGHTVEGRIEVEYDDEFFDIVYGVELSDLVLADGGVWRCVITDCVQDPLESENETLTVITKLKTDDIEITQPSHILLGSEQEYTCLSDIVNPEFDVTWTLHGQNYTNGTSENEYNGSYYTIQNTNDFTFCENRETNVTCILHTTTGTGWSAQNTVSQSLISAPAFVEDSWVSDKNPVIPDSLSLVCIASGTERRVTWKRNDDTVPDGLFTNVTIPVKDDDFRCGETEGTRSTLTWIQPPNPTCDDVLKHDGTYHCEVTGVLDTSYISEEYHIVALYGPIITGDKEIIIDAVLGSEVEMTCATNCARPDELTYKWTSTNNRDDLNQDKETISIVVTNEDFNVTFTCIVNNTVGKNQRTFVIHEIDVTISTEQPPDTTTLNDTDSTTDPGNLENPNQALVTAFAVIWSLCGVFAILLVCLALYHYKQIQNGKHYNGEYSEELVLTEDEAAPETSHGSGVYDDISPAVVSKGSMGGAVGGISNEGLYAEVQRPAQAQMPVVPKRTSKIPASQPNPGTPNTKRTQAPDAPKSPINTHHQPNSPSTGRRPEPKADYAPVSKRQEIQPQHSNECNRGPASKTEQQQKRHESPNKTADVKQTTNSAKPSIPFKPNITSVRSSRAPYDNAEVNLYANCDQRPVQKNADETVTYADLDLRKEDAYDEGAPPVPVKNMTDQEPVQYASIKHNK